jgi:hypothetical protein
MTITMTTPWCDDVSWVQDSLRTQLSEAGSGRDAAVVDASRAQLQLRKADVEAVTLELNSLERRILQEYEAFNKAQETDVAIVGRQRAVQGIVELCHEYEVLHTAVKVRAPSYRTPETCALSSSTASGLWVDCWG